MKKIVLLALSLAMAAASYAQNGPLDLQFHRLAVRRFIFSNNIPLSEFKPSEIVSMESMHPAFAVSDNGEPVCDTSFHAKFSAGKLVLDSTCKHAESAGGASIYVGAVNPYGTYEMEIDSMEPADGGSMECGIELARMDLSDRVQIVVRNSADNGGIYLRIIKDGGLNRELKYSDSLPKGPFTLRAQLCGICIGVYTEQDGVTTYLGNLQAGQNFKDVIDFREKTTMAETSFNMISDLKGRVVISGARSYLSSGVGQADIRVITYEDLSPYMEDNRVWCTFSCRGVDLSQSAQGVLSFDPSVFDIRLEGVIVYDHGDGLLRNDYSTHLFYDRTAEEWHAVACDFGGTAGFEKRTGSQLITAVSKRDPRKGFSVMKAKRFESDHMPCRNEDPCIYFDKDCGKWRLYTSVFIDGDIRSAMFESDEWDGYYKQISDICKYNSTGTSLQKVDGKVYAFSGGHGNLRVHSYPDLKYLGELDLDLQPHWPKPAGRVWASVIPLPEGSLYRYVLMTMDRPNFPGIKTATWSYGAFYLYGAF